MNVWDILIMSALAISVFFAIKHIFSNKRGCSCSDACGCCGKCDKH